MLGAGGQAHTKCQGLSPYKCRGHYTNFHYKDKTVGRPSYLYHGHFCIEEAGLYIETDREYLANTMLTDKVDRI